MWRQTASATSFEIGAFITYRDTDDDNDPDSKRFHLGKVINVADGEAHVRSNRVQKRCDEERKVVAVAARVDERRRRR